VLEENTLQFLKFLNLEDTNMASFEGIKKFKNLKALDRLILNKNKLERFGEIDGFKSLKSISIENNLVAVPIAISELGRIDSIEYFNIRHNPIGNKLGNGYVRQRSVAEFPRLTVINGADLKKYERKDC
jgi:Leucine-rich repeat (LRR) protein